MIAIVSGYTEDVAEMALDHIDLVLAKPVRVDILQQLVDLTKELVEKREAVRGFAELQN